MVMEADENLTLQVSTPNDENIDAPAATPKVNLLLYFLVIAFGWGSWIDINSIFSQYFALLGVMPEGSDIGSYIAMVIQIGNIFPLLYVIARKLKPNIFHERPIIIIILCVGVGCMFALAFTYDKVVFIGKNRAIGLPVLLCCFILAAADTTSTLTFLPYMSLFPFQYFSAFFVGQSFSGIIPSVLSFIQGSVEDKTSPNVSYLQNSLFCNRNNQNKASQPPMKKYIGDRFLTRTYFIIIAMFLILSLLAFLVIAFSEFFTRKMNKCYKIYVEERKSQSRKIDIGSVFIRLKSEWKTIDKTFISYLISLTTISFINNGVIVQLIPMLSNHYDAKVVFICTNVTLLSGAVTSVLLMWKMFKNCWGVMAYTTGSVLLTIFVLLMVILPKSIVDHNKVLYKYLLIVTFIIYGHLSSAVRQIVCTIAGACNPERMLICSIFIQVGSFCGALCMFIPISVLCVF